jgi:hypothetical protein
LDVRATTVVNDGIRVGCAARVVEG